MQFEKGKKKTGGRTKGSKNKKTLIAEAIVDRVMQNGSKDFDKIWNQLKPKEQMEFILKFMPFKAPQMARVENTTKQIPNLTINFVPASQQLEEQNTIEIGHEEVDDKDSD